MGFTNRTPNYNLPQYVSTDIPSYLVDQNGAWSAVDTAIKNVSDTANDAESTATQGLSTASEALEIAESNTTKVNGALSDFADAFSTTKTYAVGDYVIYGNVLYKCKEEITVAGPFDGSKWDSTTVGEELDSLADALEKATYIHGNDIIFTNPKIHAGQFATFLKQGNVVSVMGTILVEQKLNTDEYIITEGTIPEIYRPHIEVSATLKNSAIIKFTGNGGLKVQNISVQFEPGYYEISCTYITRN